VSTSSFLIVFSYVFLLVLFFLGFRLDLPGKHNEHPGPGKILGVCYPKTRV